MTEQVKTRNLRRNLEGIVVSDKMDKTITVLVNMQKKHPKYGKYITRSAKFHAHDESNEAKEGDTVMITETKKFSKSKTWRLAKILVRAK